MSEVILLTSAGKTLKEAVEQAQNTLRGLNVLSIAQVYQKEYFLPKKDTFYVLYTTIILVDSKTEP